ncbi:PREDICTED: RING finger protein nhl-1-like [Papilio polytes]|uniref:RING finger protein nhl-1-like n=1 Tax=Papilio polytes TaxID=76194 RepID=UPI000675BF7B|nr:PREDICTED: RING finger protein nhl-1-like [Papilio polytes]
MGDKVRKKPPFFTLKRWNSQKQNEEHNGRTPTPQIQNSTQFFKPNPSQTRTPSTPAMDAKPRKISAGGIKELVQCPLCLEVLHNPKMLPCQHTFCQACLTAYVDAEPVIDCPICCTKIQVQGTNFTADVTTCEHCKLKFCKLCWSQHMEDMRVQIGSILKQLDSAANRLEHKIEYYKDRCERIMEQINIVTEEKINAILEAKENLLQVAGELTKAGDMSALALQSSLQEAKEVATKAMTANEPVDDNDKVTTFINLHQNALQLLTEVSKWGVSRFVFDKENLCIECDAATPLDAESDDPLPQDDRHNNPLESEDTLILYYRCRNFTPHSVWRRSARPCGVGVAPWSELLYVCGADSRSVLVVERAQPRAVARLAADDMLCPVHIAFLKNLGEIYVTDKWKHCIHVFSKEGEHLRSLGLPDNRPNGEIYLYTNRPNRKFSLKSRFFHISNVSFQIYYFQILQPDGKFVDQIGVATKQQSSNTASVWDTKERVIILDSGNRRVKIYNKQDKSKILEFGSLGQRKGQFRQPEVLAVDPLGFILVGDSGNCRVQVFKPNGQLVRVFGRLGTEAGKFGWISGIHVTKQLDIIVSDTKNHSVNFF